jgi:hypothetical protein
VKVKTKKRISSAGKTLSFGFRDTFIGVRRNLASSWKRIRNREFFKGIVKIFLQTPTDAFLLLIGKIVSAFQLLIGVETIGRNLTSVEITQLKKIFHESLSYGKIRIKEDKLGFFRVIHAPFTHGDTVYIQPNWVSSESQRLQLLVHESVHIWQHQNRGTNYMSESIFAQTWGIISTGDRGYGYDFIRGISQGKSFEKLNPEQQASLIETAYCYGIFGEETIKFDLNGNDYSDYIKDSIKIIRESAKKI